MNSGGVNPSPAASLHTSCLRCISTSSGVNACDAQWEQSSWLFSVCLAARSCSVPVLRKPALRPRGSGRHNTTACERVGTEIQNGRERREERGGKKGGDKQLEEWGCRSSCVRKSNRKKIFLFFFFADRARERKLGGQERGKKWGTKWTKEERREGADRSGDRWTET